MSNSSIIGAAMTASLIEGRIDIMRKPKVYTVKFTIGGKEATPEEVLKHVQKKINERR